MCCTGDGGGHGDGAWHQGKSSRIAKRKGKTPLTVGSLALSWASPFSHTHTAQKVTKSQLFCKASSFSPKFVCDEAHGFSPDKAKPPSGWALLPLTSQSLLWLGKEAIIFLKKQNKLPQTNKQTTRKKPPKQPRTPSSEFLFLCLGLPHQH